MTATAGTTIRKPRSSHDSGIGIRAGAVALKVFMYSRIMKTNAMKTYAPSQGMMIRRTPVARRLLATTARPQALMERSLSDSLVAAVQGWRARGEDSTLITAQSQWASHAFPDLSEVL
jgi:hypothetical protein